VEWYNKIDKYQRLLKRNETNGIPIGPATSNIISELILSKIDEELNKKCFIYVRYIDDYRAFLDTYEECEEFVRLLSEELFKYKLLLNINKTYIVELPIPSSPEWILDLTTRLPKEDNITRTSLIRFLDYALSKQVVSQDGSIIKYAIKSIINNVNYVNERTLESLIQYLLTLCIKYPILLSLLNTLFEKNINNNNKLYSNQILSILNEHTINKRSDAMTWGIYYLNNYLADIDIPEDIASKVISSKECIPILFLYLSKQYDKEIVEFCNKLNKEDNFLLDRYWLLLYQLFIDNKISNPYINFNSDKDGFDILKSNNVSFILQ